MTSRPSQPFHIRPMQPRDKSAVLDLAGSLTDFFPKDYIQTLAQSLEDNAVLVGELGGEIVGFLVFAVRDPQTAEITSMAVKEEIHGLGLGSFLLQTFEKLVAREGIKKILASTLSYTVPYKPYEKVRTFYYHRGFKSLGIQSSYYEEGVDRLILVKNL